MFMQANENVLHWLRGSAGPRAATIEALEAESLNVWRTRVHSIPRVLSDAQVAHAVSENTRLGASLGWNVLYDAIAGWFFRLDMSPTEASFAQLVAEWQRANALPVNGIIDFATWQPLLQTAKAGIPATFTTAEGIARPVGLAQITAAFGDPTATGWEGRNIERANAPTGRTFLPNRTYVRVHRLLQAHFERLFADVATENVWDQMTPSSGTFVCRTKSPNQQPCGTPGIQINQLSTHSWGITIDIRAGDYPRYSAALKAANAPLRYPPATITRVFQAHGFHWGMWFMDGRLDAAGRINLTGADPHHFQFAVGY